MHTENQKIHQTAYVRNSRAVAMAWGIFTICFAILNIIAFIQPLWIGSTEPTGGSVHGYFGLYKYCTRTTDTSVYNCLGAFTNYDSILNDSFRAAAFFVGFSALLFLVCVVCFILFFFLNTVTVLQICGWIQTVAALCMFLGCVIFPNGWDDDRVREVCADATVYNPGTCGVRWAYILAIVLIFDAIILAVLAFLMAHKQKTLLPEIYTKAHMNGYASDTLSKRSQQQILHDSASDYSKRY